VSVFDELRIKRDELADEMVALAEREDLLRSELVGSGFQFADRGLHILKGVPDEWQLFALDS
jgi:hypothetical protein